MSTLIPPGLVLAEAWDQAEPAELLPGEAEALGPATERRRADYAAGRGCAHRALRALGLEPVPILRGLMREPLWPPGVTGSITHSRGHAAAVVGWRSGTRSVGIDSEPRGPMAAGVLDLVATRSERRWLDAAAGDDGVPWDLVLFSAKESVFKAWSPLTGLWLGFDGAEVSLDPVRRTFHARLTPAAPPMAGAPLDVHGRFHVGITHVFTCAAIPAG